MSEPWFNLIGLACAPRPSSTPKYVAERFADARRLCREAALHSSNHCGEWHTQAAAVVTELDELATQLTSQVAALVAIASDSGSTNGPRFALEARQRRRELAEAQCLRDVVAYLARL